MLYELVPWAEVNKPYAVGVWLFVVGSCVYVYDSLTFDPVDRFCVQPCSVVCPSVLLSPPLQLRGHACVPLPPGRCATDRACRRLASHPRSREPCRI